MSEVPKPVRRWSQFSLRSFLLVVAAFAVVAGLFQFAVWKIRRNIWGGANFVILENQTGKMLEHVSVRVSGETALSGALGPNQRYQGHFRGTGQFVVDGTFTDGTVLHAAHAGVREGAVNKAFRLMIRPDGSLRLD